MKVNRKLIEYILIGVLAVVLILQLIPISKNAVGVISNAVMYQSEWGLGYGEEGTQPRGNTSGEELIKYNAYYVGDKQEPVIYLTFDAGYENGYTEQLLEVLKKHEVPATFFLVGHYLEENEDLVKRMVDEGHMVGNHTATHPAMSSITDIESFRNELESVEEKYTEITGKELPKFYRPPQGKYSESNLKHAMELGYTTVFWSLAYVDWYDAQQPTHDYAYSKLIPRIHNGAIILLHSNSKTNSEILDQLLTKYKEMGYRFESLNHLVQGKTEDNTEEEKKDEKTTTAEKDDKVEEESQKEAE